VESGQEVEEMQTEGKGESGWDKKKSFPLGATGTT